MKKPELLAPAGNLEKLRIAVHYGADAVYLGGKSFGLRNLADNFTLDEMARAADFAHARGVKVYVTVNAFPDNSEIDSLYRYLEELDALPLDGLIVADPGVFSMVTEVSPSKPVHLSTQANTTNWKSARFWQERGVKRINLARETTLEGIRETRERVEAELEVFVHGAMCISYSGRCLLSSVMSDRPANKGECAHPCRWSYSLVEETRPGEYFPVMEDANGTFIFNSKDLCLIQFLPELVGSGVDSLKIEGRMKGIHYVASVVRVYREAIDRFFDDPQNYRFRPEWLEELCKISHRGYTTGFFLGPPRNLDHEYHSRYLRSHQLAGVVEEEDSDGTFVVAVRNRLAPGDDIEVVAPGMKGSNFTLESFQNLDGSPASVAHPNQLIRMELPPGTRPLDILRRKVR
ncbi:U32 family peptidase [Geobacter sp. DSM 9736]|uniref:peptidase U32 family protein n=1 Tax=Geobacter sp. DSM 9736 TaxID=1277350 RepID=UPI000B50BDDA|nr:U32 family peptidase [Geobacter sp. DSM 9736]SNB48112.1 putative protease [Geobacter sp. DSM 9736]